MQLSAAQPSKIWLVGAAARPNQTRDGSPDLVPTVWSYQGITQYQHNEALSCLCPCLVLQFSLLYIPSLAIAFASFTRATSSFSHTSACHLLPPALQRIVDHSSIHSVTWNTSASLVPAATMAANNMHNLTTLIKRYGDTSILC